MLAWLRKHLHTLGCDEINIRKIELATEEALVNIIEHAYREKPGDLSIELRHPTASQFELVLKDQGPPFNPLHQQTGFDPLATLEERKIGGLGIFFMRQYMDKIHYTRIGEMNVLTLIKDTTHEER